MKLASDDDLVSEINVTPLVDVMLVLLIIFMVTAPLIQQGIPVNLPTSEKSAPLPKEEKDLILYISNKKELSIDEYKVEVATLKTKLEELTQGRKERKIYIRADEKVPYGFVIEVMGQIRLAGIEKIGMVTDYPKAKKNKRSS